MRGHATGDVPDDDRDDRDQPERVDPGAFPPGGQPDLFTPPRCAVDPVEGRVPPRTISTAATVRRRGTSVASPVNGIRTMMRPRPSMTLAATRKSSMRPLVHDPMNTTSTVMSSGASRVVATADRPPRSRIGSWPTRRDRVGRAAVHDRRCGPCRGPSRTRGGRRSHRARTADPPRPRQ